MARWIDVENDAPGLAALARRFFDLRVHKLIATLRADGSPRISGVELTFAAGDLWLGMMLQSLKALDLRRDPRFALHSGSADPPDWEGDAKVAGAAEEVTDPGVLAQILPVMGASEGEAHVFRTDISELSVVRLGEPRDHLMIESWHPGRGTSRAKR